MSAGRAVSSGGIVMHDFGGIIKIALARDVGHGPNAWVLPKGHVSPGESWEQAALREIREETGLQDVQLITYLGTIVRQSVEDWGETVEKTIHVFLAYALGEEMPEKPVDPSVTELGWFSVVEALKVIPFSEDREFLRKHLAPTLSLPELPEGD